MKIRGVEISYKHLGLLFIVWAAFALSFTDRMSWPPIMPLAMRELGMTGAQAGSYMTSFYVGYVLTQLPGGLLNDRFGYRKILLASFLVMGCFTMLMGTVTSYEQGLVYRFIAGVGSGAVFSACIKAILDWYPAKIRGTVMGIFTTANVSGMAIVNLTIPTVAAYYSWQAAFLITGGITLLMLLPALFLVKEQTTVAPTKVVPAQFWRDIRELMRNKNLVIMALVGFTQMWGTLGTATWANTYMNKVLHLSLVETGGIFSLFSILGFLCKPIGGVLADYIVSKGGKKHMIIFYSFLLFGVMEILFGMNTSIPMLYVIVPVLGIAAAIAGPVMDVTMGEVVPRHLVGTAIGFGNTIWQIGSIIAPLAVGVILDISNNYFYVFVVLGIAPIIGALLSLKITKYAQV
ncbi:MAG TPA: MFS transporter [Negativicutes bacterium]